MMTATGETLPSLEALAESGELGVEILHPGGLAITKELATLCQVEPGTCVLEVASGTGESACTLAEKFGCRVVGVDFSEAMVLRARTKAAEKNLPDVTFQRGDAHHLPFDDGTFDTVITECATSVLDKLRAICQMARVVKIGGYVGIHDICWGEDTPPRLKERLAELEGERPETLEGWKRLFKKAGLVDVQGYDRSYLVPPWMKDIRREMGLLGQMRVTRTVFKKWGFSGLWKVLESERIFRDKHTGYGIIVGKKPKDWECWGRRES